MERTFYEEQQGRENVSRLKRALTLDLKNATKKLKGSSADAPLLTSPDLKMLKLATPELEKLIMDTTNGLATPTPGSALPLFTRPTPQEPESFAQGFVEALNELRQNGDSSQGDKSVGSESSGKVPFLGMKYSGGGLEFDSRVKDEPQTVPGSPPPVSPIDMEDQERIKLERKRQRNRIAASKCRLRKLERIAKLEKRVNELKSENNELTVIMTDLRKQVCNLKQQVLDHVNNGCDISRASVS